MALIIKDRVKEITTTTGTGAVSLGGASATFDAFQDVMSNGDTTFYAIVHTASATDEWEVGLGTWNTDNTLTRTTVYAGSSGTSAVNFSSGNKDVFMTYPAGKAAVTGEDVTFADITVTGTVDGRDVATDGTKLDTIETSADVTDATNVSAAGALMKSGGTMTGNLILNADPTTALGAATKEYVDTIAAAGIHYHTPVRVEAPSNLNATYDNGSSGVGATLTNAGTQAAITIDGVALSSADRVLVYNQTNAAHNGIYTVTTVGDGSTNWVLTRATDADSYAPSDPDALGEGDAYFVKEGDTGAGELYVMNTSGTITFGTTAITFVVIAETAVYSAGTGLTLTGTTFSTNQDISTSASPTFAGTTVNGNITVTGTVDGRDVATDGTKLDGIEANADVTDTANVTAAGALMDSEVTNLAQVKSFSSADYATAAQGTKADNALPKAGGTMTGNIVMSGTETVDGRDLSVDGAKLDGIEAGATADQTASEILAAIKTVDGTASGLDADLLDGQQGSYYLNTGTTFSGDVSGTYNAIVVTDDSHTHDGRYYTETEADSRFVNVTGDTMTGQLIIDHNTSTMLVLQATNGGPWAIDLGRDDVTNSKVYNGGGYWAFEHEPRFHNGGSHQKLFHDGYHPNADKWTTGRTLSLSGDASGSVSWDGSANATLSVTVANDSHSHSNYVLKAGDTMTGSLNIGAAIGSRDKTLSIDGDGDSSPLVIQCDGVDNAWGILPWTGGESYIHGGVYYDDGGWVHRSSNTTNWLFRLNGGSGAGWYASNNSSASWNVANNVSLWNSSGTWVGAVAKSPTLTLSGDVSGSATFTNLGNATLSVTVADDSHNHSNYVAKNTGYIWTSVGGSALSFQSNDTIDTATGDQASLEVYQDTAGADAFMQFHVAGDYAKYFGLHGGVNDFVVGGWSHGASYQRLFHDGYHPNADTWTTGRTIALTGDVTGTSGAFDGSGNLSFSTNIASGVVGASELNVTGNGTTAQFLRSDGDGSFTWATPTDTNTTYSAGTGVTLSGTTFSIGQAVATTDSPTFANAYIGGSLYHTGDTDTRLLFDTNTITLQCGGSSEITVNTTGVRLGDTGNGYFQPVTGNYGSIQVDGGAHGSYEGFSIGGRAVFMHDNATTTGIFNDVDNEWLFLATHNGTSRMYYNGSSKIQTTSTGATITGDLNSTSDIRYKKNVETIDNALEKVQSLRGVTFDWDNDAFEEKENTKKPNFTERATGVIAQDVEKVLPEAVRENEDGFKNVAYGNMVGLLIEAIKEQQQQIDELKKQLNG